MNYFKFLKYLSLALLNAVFVCLFETLKKQKYIEQNLKIKIKKKKFLKIQIV